LGVAGSHSGFDLMDAVMAGIRNQVLQITEHCMSGADLGVVCRIVGPAHTITRSSDFRRFATR